VFFNYERILLFSLWMILFCMNSDKNGVYSNKRALTNHIFSAVRQLFSIKPIYTYQSKELFPSEMRPLKRRVRVLGGWGIIYRTHPHYHPHPDSLNRNRNISHLMILVVQMKHLSWLLATLTHSRYWIIVCHKTMLENRVFW
jgi:hypothetical protein